MPDTYIVAYLTKMELIEHSDSGAESELIVAANCGTGPAGENTKEQPMRFPNENWYAARDGHDMLGWPQTNVGPVLEANTPWAIPIFAMPESEMEDRLNLVVVLLESDDFTGRDITNFLVDFGPAAAGAIGSAVATPAVGGAIEVGLRTVLEASRASWDDDVIAVFGESIGRDQDWGVGGGPIGRSINDDGSARFEVHVRRVLVEQELNVRVSLKRALLNDDDGDKYLRARTWLGKFLGTNMTDHVKNLPEDRERTRRFISREMDFLIYEGPIGPLLSLEFAFWEEDSGSDDDAFGTLFGLWTNEDLWQAFRRNGWSPLEFKNISRNSALSFDFTIEPTDPLTIPITQWYSAGRSDSFTTSNPAWQSTRAPDRRAPDYTLVDSGSKIFNPALPAPAGTVPLYALWSGARKDNFLTSDPKYAGDANTRQESYYRFAQEGYIYSPDLDQPNGTLPLVSWWNSATMDNMTTSASAWRGEIGDTKDGYTLYRLEGYVLNSTSNLI